MIRRPIIVVLGAGFIGRNLIRSFLSSGYTVRVLDNNICPDEFVGKLFWLQDNFSNKEALLQVLCENIDVVYHLVSSTVPGSDTDKKIIQELYDNVFTTIEFINICLLREVKRIVFASSSSVYGLQERFPIDEQAPTNPISAHGIQKLTLEKYFQLFEYIEGIEVKIARISNPYGPGQNVNGRQGFIAIVIGNIINNTPVMLRDNGNSVRDYIYIDDLVDALQKIGLKDNVPSLINIGSGIPYSLNDVVRLINSNLGKPVNIISGEKRKIDIPKSVLNIGLAQEVLDFEPKIALQDGIRETLNYHGLISTKKV